MSEPDDELYGYLEAPLELEPAIDRVVHFRNSDGMILGTVTTQNYKHTPLIPHVHNEGDGTSHLHYAGKDFESIRPETHRVDLATDTVVEKTTVERERDAQEQRRVLEGARFNVMKAGAPNA